MKTERNINIEILRSLSMFMILILHFFNHGQILERMNNELNLSNVMIISLEVLSIVAVNVFVLISGYFLCKSKFNIKKIIKLISEVWIYSIILGAILILTKTIDINLKNIIYILLPFLTQRYWFVNAYILMLLLSPFLNNFITTISKEKFKLLMFLLFIINSVLPIGIKSSVSLSSANSLPWFINLYFMASYIRIYGLKHNNKNNYLLIYSITNIIFIIFAIIVFEFGHISKLMYILKYNLPFTYISSLSLFMVFLNLKFDYNKITNKIIRFISSSTFSIYIIHENHFIRDLLWTKWLKVPKYFNKYGFIYMFVALICVFLICILIDKIISLIYNKLNFNCRYINEINDKLK